MFDIFNKFFEKVKKDRHELMVRKGYITKDVVYSDDIWKSFREEWLSKPAI
jgi:predicted restriction endonuclease